MTTLNEYEWDLLDTILEGQDETMVPNLRELLESNNDFPDPDRTRVIELLGKVSNGSGNGVPLTAAEIQDRIRNGWRMYDINCPFSMSHTKHWCGYEHCSDG